MIPTQLDLRSTDRGGAELPTTLPGNGSHRAVRLMPIVVAGMHRSGTSMVAALLYHAGLYLGARKELMPPGPDNEDGYWENVRFVELNEELLRAAGGGWDEPPKEFDLHKPEIQAGRVKAEALRREVDPRHPAGWKGTRK